MVSTPTVCTCFVAFSDQYLHNSISVNPFLTCIRGEGQKMAGKKRLNQVLILFDLAVQPLQNKLMVGNC